jgi:hypothetical protein
LLWIKLDTPHLCIILPPQEYRHLSNVENTGMSFWSFFYFLSVFIFDITSSVLFNSLNIRLLIFKLLNNRQWTVPKQIIINTVLIPKIVCDPFVLLFFLIHWI